MYEHLVFFDGECPLCHRAVRQVIAMDADRKFLFAPLSGETARDILSGPQEKLRRANSLVLVENYESTDRTFWIRSKAVGRIYWLCGKRAMGCLSFLPAALGDFIYKIVANHRHQFKMKMPKEPGPEDRFLP